MNKYLVKFAYTIFVFSLFIKPIFVFSEDVELDATLFESSELMQSGRISEALALLKSVESKYSGSREYLNNLAVVYLGNSQPEEALSILRQLVDNDPLYNIITHNLLEMELQINDTRPENINPVLFTQTVDTFFTGEITELQQPQSQRTEIVNNQSAAALNTAIAANTPIESGVSSQQKIQHGIIAKAVISNWASSWSNKNYSAYISNYSSDFISAKGLNFPKWTESRKWALNKPGNIQVEASNFNTESLSSDQIIVIFDQSYSSTNYNDKVQKELTLIRENADWKILKEITIKTY